MPFGNYKDFADCVKQNQDKDNPEAYCGQIQHQVEGNDDKKESDKTTDTDVLYKRVSTPILQKLYKDSDGRLHFAAYISSTIRDRDGDKFHKDLLAGTWVAKLNSGKINIGQDHGHSWKDSLGVWKRGEIRQNPKGDDIHSAKNYLFAEGVLEDPDINNDVKLLWHKAEIGEQISLSIAANPEKENWFDKEIDTDGRPVRVIKSADLLKADVVGEPANPDARMIGIFLKHAKCETGKCLPNCEGCFVEKDFAECIKKSMIAPNTKIEQIIEEKASCKARYGTIKDGSVKFSLGSKQDQLLHARDLTHSHVCVHSDGSKSIERFGTKKKSLGIEDDWTNDKDFSSLVNENESINVMKLSKEDQNILNKEHGCKEGERYCPDEGKCMPESETKSVNKDQSDCPPGHKYNAESGKCEKEEMKALNPDVEKFIAAMKAISGADPNGTQIGSGLESIVQQALASMRTPPTAGKLELNIPSPIIPVTPGVSGTSGAQPQTTGIPATPNLATGIPIPSATVQATPGNSGSGPAPAGEQGTPAATNLANPSSMPTANIQAAKEPEIQKRKGKSILANAKELMKSVEEARKKVAPKHENPGEISPTLIDASKLTGEVKKHAEAYNAEVVKANTVQIRQIYTPTDLVEKSERGELLKELDENNTFQKVVKTMAKNRVEKQIVGSLLLTKAV